MAHNTRSKSPMLVKEEAPVEIVRASPKIKVAQVTPRAASKTSSIQTPKSYASDGVKNNDIFLLPASDWQIMIALTVVCAIVRLFRIYQPSSVVFDEVHFGGFASKYIKGKFFMDVHPPLAKLLLTLAGYLAGFDGEFDFKDIGKDYIEPQVPYVAMRMLPAICGIFLAPTMFLTLKAAGCRTMTAAMGMCCIIFENGLLTQARLILLDSPLMIMTAFTGLAFTTFSNQHELGPVAAFRPSWWFWLLMTGLGLGATASVKWVGLFTIAWVGSLTALQMWVLLGDTKNVTPRIFTKHLFARIFCLIIVPAGFYMGMFAIHFLCLVNPGEGDGFMSSEFQATLNSKAMQDVPADVAFGSRVSIRHHNTQGGYLHSHNLMYPTGSKQQQITLYPHKDENNVWLLENQTQPLDQLGNPLNGSFVWDAFPPASQIMDGDVIKLFHVVTSRRLHSHDVRAPVTEVDWQNEVSAYGYDGFEGDANDLFRVEIIPSMSDGAKAKKMLRTIQTKFKLVHVMTGCVLFSHKVKLPEWASEQQEVTCARGGTLPNSVWYVEDNQHPGLDKDAETVNYRKLGFLGKFLELNKVMWQTNAGLVESHAWDSRPPSWPILKRGINFWGKDNRQIYLIGNPMIWWSATAALGLYVLFKGLSLLRWQRGFRDYDNVVFKRFDYEIGSSVLGWAFHYFPFFLMQRQLFLHHYFPALYFAIIALCQMYDFVTARVPGIGLRERPYIGRLGITVFLALTTVVFALYSPLAYGNAWTKSACNKVKLFDTWDWDCNTFFDDYSEYNTPSSVAGIAPTSAPAMPSPAEKAGAQVPLGGEQIQQQNAPPPMSDAPPLMPSIALPPGQSIVSREEKIEYRDQDGNLLDEEQVKALQGKVSFKTRYETRTRMVDAAGNEVGADGLPIAPDAGVPGAAKAAKGGVAPPHPDVEGVDRETNKGAASANVVGGEGSVASVREEDVRTDEDKERSIASEAGKRAAKPASEGREATGGL